MTTSRTDRRQGGPPPMAPAVAYAVLMLAGVALSVKGAQPSTPPADALAYDRAHAAQLGVAGFFQFAAALPLAIWTATVYRRLRTLGVTAPGAVMALVGGVLAAASMALSGLLGWTTAQVAPHADAAVVGALTDLGFATGAAGFVVPFALLIAGVAVPALILRFTPRWFAWAGLVVAAIGMVATFTLLTDALDPTLPVGRFGGLIWIVAASVLLPARRQRNVTVGAAQPAS